LLAIEAEIQSNKDAYTNSTLDTQSSQLSITQQENSLQTAKDNLSYYSIYAPFDGIIASVPVQKGQNVGSGTTLSTIITTKQIANVSLNEIDVAKIQLGQKVTLTFDAIPNLTITGKIAQIDSVGTVSQGVVNYNVKISFDTYDSSVKPGMSVNAAIITNVHQDVLTVPNGAVKTSGGASYVQTFSAPLPAPAAGVQGSPSAVPPTSQTITVGISNNTSTEILSGLNEGDTIVTRTISPTGTTATTTAPSILGTPGGGARGGGAIRIGG
jgi:HlyD family secretion protein